MKPLTKEQLRDNAAAILAFADGKPIELFTQGGWSESQFTAGDAHLLLDCMGQGNHYRPKPQPSTHPWSKPEDVPGPVCWIRPSGDELNRDAQEYMIHTVDKSGVRYGKTYGMDFPIVGAWQYSTDRKTWKSCTVEDAP
jgi:hypothetical protein